jgi:hypothetical protein
VTVHVIVPGNTSQTRTDGQRPLVVARAGNPGMFSSDPTVVFDTEIYRATTDGGGTCIVYGIDGSDDLVLGVRTANSKRMQRVEGVAFGERHSSREIVLRAP